jgi:dTDP-4-amino-4,6-dideoxygalactose transaminase
MKVRKVPYLDLYRQNKSLEKYFAKDLSRAIKDSAFILGPAVEEFERSFADYLGSKFCVGVSNGTDAIEMAIRALNIGEGDEVIVPTNSFIASALGVTRAGATPVFCDSDENFHLSLSSAESMLSSRTKALVVVSLYGQLPDMNKVMEFAKRHDLKVVEDFAQAQGATFEGRSAGTFGDIGCTSFYPGKNLGALGDAGGVVTQSQDLYNKVMALRTYGGVEKYRHPTIGFNNRIDAIQAKFLTRKLEVLDQWNSQRAFLARRYDEALVGLPSLVLPKTVPGANHVWHIYAVLTEHRDSLQKYLSEQGVGTIIHYPTPIHKQGAYRDCKFDQGIRVADTQASNLLSLPLFPGMASRELDYVSEKVREFFS